MGYNCPGALCVLHAQLQRTARSHDVWRMEWRRANCHIERFSDAGHWPLSSTSPRSSIMTSAYRHRLLMRMVRGVKGALDGNWPLSSVQSSSPPFPQAVGTHINRPWDWLSAIVAGTGVCNLLTVVSLKALLAPSSIALAWLWLSHFMARHCDVGVTVSSYRNWCQTQP